MGTPIIGSLSGCASALRYNSAGEAGKRELSRLDLFIQAVIKNDGDTVRAELANGRNPNEPDEFGWVPLHRAAANDSTEAAKILLAAGSTLEATGTDAWTPLHLAAVSGSARMVELLAAAGANVNATSNYGDTPLHLCVTSCNVEAAQTLLRAGANPAISNHKGLTPLAKARQNDCAPLVRVLQDS